METNKLSNKALEDLRSVLRSEMPQGEINNLSDDELNTIGDFLLTVFVGAIKNNSWKDRVGVTTSPLLDANNL
jgi:hypothetical protein